MISDPSNLRDAVMENYDLSDEAVEIREAE